MAMSMRAETRYRVAVSSYLESEQNHIQVVDVNAETGRMEVVAEVDQSFPATKLMWRACESGSDNSSNMFASSSTTLNIFRMQDKELSCILRLANTRTQGPSGHSPPLTSFD